MSGRSGRTLTALTPQGTRRVGLIVRDSEGRMVLRKEVDEREHLLRFPHEAWAIQVPALEEAEALGVERVEVHDPRTGRLWWCELADFARFGVPFDRGHGLQVALALKFWSFLPSVPADRMTHLGELFPSILSSLTAGREVCHD